MALVGSSAGVPENKLGTGLFGRPTSKDRSQLCPLIQLRSASGPPYVSGSATSKIDEVACAGGARTDGVLGAGPTVLTR